MMKNLKSFTKIGINNLKFNNKNNLQSSLNLINILKRPYFSYPCPRKLREIVKVTLFEREQPEKIKEIWQTYYDEKPNAIGTDIKADEMKLIIENGKANPFFIFPVRKQSGHYILLAQNQEKSFIYTFLEDYKANPHNATPYLVVTMFDELVFKKGVALVRGDVIGDLSKKESEIIFNMTKLHYTNETFYKKVVTFNRDSSNFNHQEHIDYCLRHFNNTDNLA